MFSLLAIVLFWALISFSISTVLLVGELFYWLVAESWK